MANRNKAVKSVDEKSQLPVLNPSFERMKRVYIAQISKADSKPQKVTIE